MVTFPHTFRRASRPSPRQPRNPLLSFPGYSRDLLQDGEHPVPGAGPARDKCLVVHNHPLVVVPAGKEGGMNTPWGHCPSLPAAPGPRATSNQEKEVALGGEGELTSVTLTVQLDQVSSAPTMLSVCSREGYGSPVLIGIQVNSSARRCKSLHHLAPMSPAQRAPTDACPLAQTAPPPPGPSNPKFTSWLPSEGLSLDGEPAGERKSPRFPKYKTREKTLRHLLPPAGTMRGLCRGYGGCVALVPRPLGSVNGEIGPFLSAGSPLTCHC